MTHTPYQFPEYFSAFDITYSTLHIPKLNIEIPYNIEKKSITCFLTLMEFSISDIVFIVEYIFNTKKNVKKINIGGGIIINDTNNLPPCISQTLNFDNITILPDKFEHFFSSLGYKTRQHLRQYIKKFATYNNTIHFEKKILTHASDLNEYKQVFDSLYILNEERCIQKGFHSGAKRQWFNIVRKTGEIYGYFINDKLVAGTMYTFTKQNLYLHMIAHDNNYNSFNLGNLILLDTIERAINKKIIKFHFLWGQSEYKKRFKATPIPLYSLIFYRNSVYVYFYKSLNKIKDILSDFTIKVKNIIKQILIKIGIFNYLKKILKKD